jgi:hypothetical protein
MKCKKCGNFFSKISSSCGTGWSWDLFKCPHCEKLYATCPSWGFIHPQVLENKDIVILEDKR